jgi:transcription-repair coupling factor (superfamily II helicase)
LHFDSALCQRRLDKGFSFCLTVICIKQIESSFVYEDTPDQTKSTQEVKADMKATWPAGSIVCGE